MKTLCSLLLFVCFSLTLHAQTFPKNANKTDKKGLRQGKWTILYDKDWKPITDASQVEFYRLITYKDDKPVGKVQDHYKNGTVQMEGIFLADRPEEVMDGIIIFYDAQGKKEKEAIYKAGKLESEKSFIDENSWKALNDEGTRLYQAGKYNEATLIFEKSKNQVEKEFGKEHTDYATVCNNLGVLYRKIGKYNEAESLYIESKNIREKVLGKEHPDYATSCNNLADLYQIKGKYTEAEPLYIESKNIREKVLGKENNNYATVCSNLANLYKYQSKYNEAESLYLESKNIREKLLGKNHPEYATSCNNLAYLYVDQGKYTEAELLYLESKNIREKVSGKQHIEYANICNNLGVLYLNQGKYTELVENILIESKNTREKILGKESIDYAASCNNLANLYEKQGKYNEAELLYIEAKNIREKIFGKEHPEYATSCNNLGVLYKIQGKYDLVEILYTEAKKIYEKKLGKEHFKYALYCNNLADLYKYQGKYTEAEFLLIESKNIREKIFGKEHPEYATSCNNLGLFYVSQSKYSEADLLYLEAKNIWEKILGKKHPNYVSACNNFALSYQQQKKYIDSEILHIEASKSCLMQIEDNFSNLSEKEKSQYYLTLNDVLKGFNSFAHYRYAQNKNIAGEVYNNTLATKALLFNETNKMRAYIMQSNDASLKTLYQDWVNKKEYLIKVYQTTIANRQKQGIDVGKLETEANEVERQLASQSTLFAKVTNKTRYTWQDVQKTLKVGEVAIEIIRFQVYDKKWTDTTKYMALIIKPNAQHPEMVVLHNGNDLEGKHFEEYQKNMKEKNTDKNAYLPYWGKIAQKLTGVKKVYLSADGIYQKLNLNTLLNPATGKYLLEELDIQLVTSTRDLVLPKKASKPHESAVLMGFPAYNIAPDTTQKQPTNIKNQENITNSKTRFFDGETIEELPATKIEVEKLQEILAKTPIKTTAYVGKEASEPTLKQVNSPSILHIATHGFFMESSKKEAEKELTLGMDSKKVFENPLLRSGVLLAHAKNAIKQGGDGVLTAYEAMNLNLDETDLVVLSACDTGLGEVRNGEGVYGLQRAFQTAGAKTVLMSLWKVSDNATQELSVEFYKNLILKKQSKQLAFKNAQNELRLRYPHPYYWGAFVMVGE